MYIYIDKHFSLFFVLISLMNNETVETWKKNVITQAEVFYPHSS